MKKNFQKYFVLLALVSFFPTIVFAVKSNDPLLEQWAYDEVGLYEAWNYSTGSKEVVVAIIDNGFDTLHPDLKDNVWQNKKEIPGNNIDDDKNGFVDDVDGWNFFQNNNNTRIKVEDFSKEKLENGIYNHATYVAGIIGARGNNALAGAGINWNVSLMNLKVVDDRGVGGLKQIEEAIYYAVNNGAHIINISIVGNEKNAEKSLLEAIDYAFSKGVLVVAAAGNDMYDLDESPRYPVCFDNYFDEQKIIGVSAVNSSYRLAPFSNTGNCIDITAPGMHISSTLFFQEKDLSTSTDKIFTGSLHGTSFSTPFVSGAAALIKSINMDWTARDIMEILFKSVHHTRGQDEEIYESLFGAGLLRIDNAVKYAISKKNDLQKNNLLIISGEDGVYRKENFREDLPSFFQEKQFKNLLDIKLTKINDKDTYLVFKKNESEHEILFFDLNLNFIKKIKLNFSGEADFVLADIFSNSNPEIITSPKYNSNIYFQVFDLNGRLIKTHKRKLSHNGAFVETIKNIGKKDFISLVYKIDTDVFVEELDRDLKSLNNFKIEDFDFSDFILENVDTDFEEEYIFSSAKDAVSKITIVNNKILDESFEVYDEKYKNGFKIFAFDYDLDEKKDLILTASDNRGIMILNFKGEEQKSWESFSNDLFIINTI